MCLSSLVEKIKTSRGGTNSKDVPRIVFRKG
jgi:hypothetical protein